MEATKGLQIMEPNTYPLGVQEARGNLWDLALADDVDAVCVTTNGFVTARGECVMGGGVAKEAKDRWPDLPQRLGAHLKEHGNRPFRFRVAGLDADLVSFPTKPVLGPAGEPGFKVPADPELILVSAHHLVTMADKFSWRRVLIPRPGAGLGQLDWDEVRALLAPVLDDRFTCVSF
jgi:hypothetical protein